MDLLLPVAHDELYDYVLAGASGPEHLLWALTEPQLRCRSSALRAIPEILGSHYEVVHAEPPHRIDIRLGRTGIHGMILTVDGGLGTCSLTVYLWAADHRWILPWHRLRAARIRRIAARAHRIPALVAHPSWPGTAP